MIGGNRAAVAYLDGDGASGSSVEVNPGGAVCSVFERVADDVRENLSEAILIPGSGGGFQNIRNLGANSNQPLITNQNDFQIFDSVTRSTGRHTHEVRRQPDAPLA